MELKVGMIVRQRKDSHYYHQSKELIGKVLTDEGTWHAVKWSNGTENSYCKKHLEIVKFEDHGQYILIQEER